MKMGAHIIHLGMQAGQQRPRNERPLLLGGERLEGAGILPGILGEDLRTLGKRDEFFLEQTGGKPYVSPLPEGQKPILPGN